MIEQTQLHVPPRQRLVEMLAMNIDQVVAQALELLHRHRMAVDEGARATVRSNNAPYQALIVFVDLVFGQPLPGVVEIRKVEFRAEFRAPRARPNGPGTAALAEY